jgi:hypothetical protein
MVFGAGLEASAVLVLGVALTLLWRSQRWRTTDKLAATLLLIAGMVVFPVLMRSYDGGNLAGAVVLLGFTPFAAAVVHLGIQMRRLPGAPALTA